MLDTHALRVFLEAARTENFTEAGRVLNLTQPAVSMQVKTLEDYLQVKLFERSGRKMKLTKVGQSLLPMAQQIVQLAINTEEAIRASTDKVVGNLVVGSSSAAANYILPNIVMRFQRLYPDVSVSIPVVSRETMMERVACGDYDLGVTTMREPDYDVGYAPFFVDELVLVSPSSHPWSRESAIDPADLLHERFICREPQSGCRAKVAEGLSRLGLNVEQLQMVMEIGSAEALAMAVENGLGMSFVSKPIAVSRLPLGRLSIVHVKGLELTSPVELVYSPVHAASLARTKFLDFVKHPQTRSMIDMLAQGQVI